MKKTLVLMSTTVVAVAVWITTCCSGAEPAPDAKPSAGEAAIKQAADAGKHLYLFFYSEDNDATREARKSFEAVMAKMTDVAQWMALKNGAPAEKALVDRFQLQGLSIPLIIVLAPNGAVTTAGLAEKMPEVKLRDGIAGPCQQKCLKALQEKKTVVLCAYPKDLAADDPSLKAVNDLKADALNAGRVEVVRIDPADPAEAAFLRQLDVDPKRGLATVMIAPGRVLLGKFIGPVTKQSLAAALKSTGSG